MALRHELFEYAGSTTRKRHRRPARWQIHDPEVMPEDPPPETGAESLFTNDLIYEFTRNREESLVKDAVSKAVKKRS